MNYTDLPKSDALIEAQNAYLHVPGHLWKLVIYPSEQLLKPFKQDYLTIITLSVGLLLSLLVALLTLLVLHARLQNRQIAQTNSILATSNQDLESFSYSVSHDLRAPLRHMNGFANLLTKNSDDFSDKQKRYLQLITESAHRMGLLIDDLLHFSRTSRAEINVTEVDLNNLIELIRTEMTLEIEHRTINWEIETLPLVYGDNNLLRQVFYNFISNAVKYTQQRDIANITIRSHKQDENKIAIEICDNGVGFDMTYADKLFGVFQRLHRSEEFEGTGIGLATIKRIIQRHGGQVWAKSKLNQGSQFYCTLYTQVGALHEIREQSYSVG